MKLIIDTAVDTFYAATQTLRSAYHGMLTDILKEGERLGNEQRADLAPLRTRVDAETATNAAAAAAFGAGNANEAHQPNRPDDHIPAANVPVPPAPPVVPVAPLAAAPAPVVIPPGVALDTEGLPWDARIHAATKTKVANGSWKKKKGTDPALVATVIAELRAVMGLPVPAGPLAATPYPFPVPPVVPAAPVPVPPVAAVPVAPQPPAAPVAITTFAQLMGYISAQIAAGKWSHPETLTACQANGITALPLLASRPDLVPGVAGTIAAMIAAKG